MKGYLVSNDKFEPPADGWVQILASGEWPNAEAGITQVCDGQALDDIVKDFKEQAAAENWPGMLVDWDHFSHQKDKPTGAAGWADNVERRGEGLWAHIRFTETGDKAVRGGEYRLLSPVLAGFETVEGERKRPSKLVRLALTNDPNITGMKPVSNRGTTTKRQEKSDMEYKDTLTELLGLNREASDDDITKAVQGIKDEVANRAKPTVKEDEDEDDKDKEAANRAVTELTNRIAELEGELAETHAAKFDTLVGDDKDAKQALRELFVMNRGAAVKVLEAIKPAKVEKVELEKPKTEPIKPLFNRRVQPLPGAAKGEDKEEAQSEAVMIEAKKLFAANREGGWSNAWAQAKNSVGVKPNGE